MLESKSILKTVVLVIQLFFLCCILYLLVSTNNFIVLCVIAGIIIVFNMVFSNINMERLIFGFVYILLYIGCLCLIKEAIVPGLLILPCLALMIILVLVNINVLNLAQGLITSNKAQIGFFSWFLTFFWLIPLLLIGGSPIHIVALTSYLLLQFLILIGIETYISKNAFSSLILSIVLVKIYYSGVGSSIVGFYLFLALVYFFFIYEKKNVMNTFIADNRIIEGHMSAEFYILNVMRKVYVLNVMLIVSFYPEMGGFDLSFLDHEKLVNVVWTLILALNMFFILIRSIIISYCNPLTKLQLAQQCVNCVIGGGTLYTIFQGWHIVTTCEGYKPMPIPVVTRRYQVFTTGIHWETVAQGHVMHRVLNLGGVPIPNAQGAVDLHRNLEYANILENEDRLKKNIMYKSMERVQNASAARSAAHSDMLNGKRDD